ncbi:MAG: hypothetical protein CM1200mP35_07280 [Chloroflexota bacterium]|nr:MAG: hypothetical protein CM1200mP35_07280 [Chloroflexota bacterium]
MDYEYKCRACDELFTCEIAPTKEIRTRVCVKCIATYSKVERYFRVLRKDCNLRKLLWSNYENGAGERD